MTLAAAVQGLSQGLGKAVLLASPGEQLHTTPVGGATDVLVAACRCILTSLSAGWRGGVGWKKGHLHTALKEAATFQVTHRM
jgi:hypothetical protein